MRAGSNRGIRTGKMIGIGTVATGIEIKIGTGNIVLAIEIIRTESGRRRGNGSGNGTKSKTRSGRGERSGTGERQLNQRIETGSAVAMAMGK